MSPQKQCSTRLSILQAVNLLRMLSKASTCCCDHYFVHTEADVRPQGKDEEGSNVSTIILKLFLV